MQERTKQKRSLFMDFFYFFYTNTLVDSEFRTSCRATFTHTEKTKEKEQRQSQGLQVANHQIKIILHILPMQQ